MEWLSLQGLSKQASVSPRGSFIILDASVSQLEKLLDAEYSAFSKISYFIPNLVISNLLNDSLWLYFCVSFIVPFLSLTLL